MSSELAAVVKKPACERVAELLRAEGVYDDSRRIKPVDDDRIALPVSTPPNETAVGDVRRVDLPARERGLGDVLRSRGADPELIETAPSSWAIIGSVVLVDFGDVSAEETLDNDGRETIGEALLELHGTAETVLARGGVSGSRRDPNVSVVAGINETKTVHIEHGTTYALDLAETMFSPGNKAERARMGEVVEPGDHVFDAFAGIGYFTLPMARAGAKVTAAEIDPVSHRYLEENIRRNSVSDRVDTVLGDCRSVDMTADRVVMGYYDAHEYLDTALDAVTDGGVIHLHEATPEPLFPYRPIERLEAAAEERGQTVEPLHTRRVKSYSAGVVHGVVDAEIR